MVPCGAFYGVGAELHLSISVELRVICLHNAQVRCLSAPIGAEIAP